MKDMSNKWKKKLSVHKKLLAKVGREFSQMNQKEKTRYMMQLKKACNALVLEFADYKCCFPGCESEDITFHHFINRNDRPYFMSEEMYIAQRNYWANITVLCPQHHHLAEAERGIVVPENHKTISDRKINRIKERMNGVEK